MKDILDIPKKLPKLKEIISSMHPTKKHILHAIVQHTLRIANYSTSNKMPMEHLITALASSIIFANDSEDDAAESELDLEKEDENRCTILSLIVAFHKDIFA